MAYKTTVPLSVRFEKRFTKRGVDECWLWRGNINRNGYGVLCISHTAVTLAHRYSFSLYRGRIPKGLSVLHKCDCRNCVNPKHLFLGTQADNVYDMQSKGRGRGPEGIRNKAHKLTEEQVREMRRLCIPKHPTRSTSALAKKYGISRNCAELIIKRRAWKHIRD